MPIEIRELVVRARVDPAAEAPPTRPGAAPARRKPEQEDLVQSCVREVLRILEDKQER